MSDLKTPLRTSSQQNAMIVALEPIEFIPCGRRIIGDHPGVSCLHIHQSHGLVRLDRSLIGSFSKVTLDDKSRDAESLDLRKYEDAEEELYVCGHTIVWSRGCNVISTFTIDSSVKHTVWCSFIVDGEDPHLHDLCKGSVDSSQKKEIEGFAAVSDGSLHMFSREGDDYVTSLPFQVRKIWSCDFGVIFERQQNQNDDASSVGLSSLAESTLPTDNALTTVFCLQHPLREFSPVVKKFQGIVRYMNHPRESIIFCDENLVMTFDSKHGLHTVWKMRAISQDDANSLENNLAQQQQMHNQMSSLPQMSISSPGTSPMRSSYRGSPAAPLLSSIGAPPGVSHPAGLVRTPHASKNPSFAHLPLTPSSSKLCSPATAASMNYASHTFSPLLHSPHIVRSPSTPISHESLCLNDTVHESAEPLRPEVCFEHVWSESVTGTREGLNIGPATRAFLTEDVCGQKFLAYYIDSLRQLRMVKYGLSNDGSQFIFGAVSSFPAKDAAPLKELNMIAVLDMVGTITLYTGSVKMVKMHVTGVPVLSLSLSHGLRNATPTLGTPQPVSTPAHPSRPGSILGNLEEVGHLSPVPELALTGETDLSLHIIDEYPFSSVGQPTSSVASLPHVVGNDLLLEVTNGAHYKTEVPKFCSTSLVATCMKALRHVLPSDTFLQLTIKWYSMRHCPGSMASYQSEWAIFEACIRELIGYSSISNRGTFRSNQMNADTSVSPVVAPKKARHVEQGNSADWQYLLQSDFHKKSSPLLARIFTSPPEDDDRELPEEPKFELLNRSKRRSSLDRSIDRATAGMHPLCPVFCALHLVYEEQKLNVTTWSNVSEMSKFLQQLANDMNLHAFSRGYATDNPDLIRSVPKDEKEFDPQVFRLPSCFSTDLEQNIFANLHSIIASGNCPAAFPVIPGVTERTRHMLMIYDCLFRPEVAASSTVELGPFVKASTFKKEKSIEMEEGGNFCKEVGQSESHAASRAMRYMVKAGITTADLTTVPHGVAIPILTALHRCKDLPDLDFPKKALELIGRHDLVRQNSPEMKSWDDAPLSPFTDPTCSVWQPASRASGRLDGVGDHEEREILATVLGDGSHEEQGAKSSKARKGDVGLTDNNVTRLLFPNDHRISAVRQLLQSDRPVLLDVVHVAGASSQEFITHAKSRLLDFCNRTLALSVGRGMATLQTEKPTPTEPFQIPKMNLAGTYMPGCATVELGTTDSEVPPRLKDWPLFHHGVATGLKIKPRADDTSWLYLNKAGGTTDAADNATPELSPGHAGFLFAAGLNGHLEKLHTLKIHDYLTKTHEMTTVGLLLGLGVTKCGTCDLGIMRLLSVHIPALLPPTATEFDVPRIVQTAAVTAVGFLHLGSAQRLVAEVMLREIDRPPGAENDDGKGREAYALSCGLALGSITLGRGGNIPELADLNIPDHLYHYMTGRKKPNTELSMQSVILEGDQINTEVTAPGAILALTLMFLKTNNSAIADWFTIPDTLLQLEAIKPQHLMLRVLAGSLILWDFVAPSKQWVESHVPNVILKHLSSSTGIVSGANLDVQTVLQCHASIVSGACLALGIRFAGSQNNAAYQTLRHFVLFFFYIWKGEDETGVPVSYPQEVLGRYMLDTCLSTCLLALSMVVAGSGNLETLQICRYLRVKVGDEIHYGTQMATHMAIGFLFLGGCRKTLCTSNKAIVSLLTSCYPCFPSSTVDNQYHLQALRHFYVLATDQRLLVPVDSVTNLPSYAQIHVKFLPGTHAKEHSYTAMAPCILPEIAQLKEVAVRDPRHWPIVVDVQSHPEKLRRLLECGMSVQRRTGFQLYIRDPKGYRSLMARSCDFSKSSFDWQFLLSDDSADVETFTKLCLDSSHDANRPDFATSEHTPDDAVSSEMRSTSHLSSLLTKLVAQERTRSLYAFCGLQQICDQIRDSDLPSPMGAWQLKMAVDYMQRQRLAGAKKDLDKGSSGETEGGREHKDEDEMDGSRFVALLSTEMEGHFAIVLKELRPALLSLLHLPIPDSTGGTRSQRLHALSGADQPSRTFAGVSQSALWKLICFSILHSLPPSFLFPPVKSEGVPAEGCQLIDTLRARGIHGKGAIRLYKALKAKTKHRGALI